MQFLLYTYKHEILDYRILSRATTGRWTKSEICHDSLTHTVGIWYTAAT